MNERTVSTGDSFDWAEQDGHLFLTVVNGMGEGVTAALLTSLAVNAIRNARRDANKLVETEGKGGVIPEDEAEKAKEQIQDLTKQYEHKIEDLVEPRRGRHAFGDAVHGRVRRRRRQTRERLGSQQIALLVRRERAHPHGVSIDGVEHGARHEAPELFVATRIVVSDGQPPHDGAHCAA